MAVCDMCNQSISRGAGLLVPGKSTTGSFKKETSSLLSSLGLDEDAIASAVDETAALMEGAPSLVCDGCAGKLGLSSAQRDEARRKASAWWRSH